MMGNVLNMAAYGAVFAVVTSIMVSITVNITQPPPPTAQEIGAEVVRQYSEQVEAARQSAQSRKNAMRCGLPGYEDCR